MDVLSLAVTVADPVDSLEQLTFTESVITELKTKGEVIVAIAVSKQPFASVTST